MGDTQIPSSGDREWVEPSTSHLDDAIGYLCEMRTHLARPAASKAPESYAEAAVDFREPRPIATVKTMSGVIVQVSVPVGKTISTEVFTAASDLAELAEADCGAEAS